MNCKYKLENNKLHIIYDFKDVYKKTLLLIKSNDGVAEFENRDTLVSDVDDLGLRWEVCDELLEMGLLKEDEESVSVFYELTQEGEKLIKSI